MLLDRIEIDNHGPLNRVEIGPLSHHLNVVLGPSGSGKTAISRFIRDSLIDREYPRGMLSSSTGRIVWVDSNGWIHCRREQDGTPGGRRTVEFESRGENRHDFQPYTDGWFDPSSTATQTATSYRNSLASRTLQSIRIPESIVDGVLVDTTVSSVSRVVASCLSAGLDRDDLARLPFENETAHYAGDESHTRDDDRRRREWRSELADVEAELAKCRDIDSGVQSVGPDNLRQERESILRRREQIITRREAYAAAPDQVTTDPITRDEEARLRTLHHQAESLRMRAASLQRWIAELDSKSHSIDCPMASAASYSLPPVWKTASVDSLRDQIARADDEIVSLRRVLADLRGIREMLVSASATYGDRYPHNWLDRDWMMGRRYGHFVQAMDHYRSDRPWADFYHTAYQPLHPVDDLAMRIEATQRHLQSLMSRFDGVAAGHRGYEASSWIGYDERREVMQQAVRRASEQIRHRDYLTASHMDLLISELNQTLDHLLTTRARTVETLAHTHVDWGREYVTPTSYHPDWLAERRAAAAELSAVENDLRRTLDDSARIRRSYRTLPIVDSVDPVGLNYDSQNTSSYDLEIARLDARLREIDALIANQNAAYSVAKVPSHRIEMLRRRRDVLVAELNRDRPVPRRESSLAELASRWLVRLSGGRHQMISWSTSPTATDNYTRMDASASKDRTRSPSLVGRDRLVHVSIDRVDEQSVTAVTRALACLAVRMAAGELLGRIGHSLPLVLETHRELFAAYQSETLNEDISVDPYRHWTREGVTSDAIASALSDYAAAGRQLLVLTEHVPLAHCLRRSGARGFELHTHRIVHPHRPLWRSGQRADHYVGPHGIDADGLPAPSPIDLSHTEIDARVNRAFDQAWIETAGLRDDHTSHHFYGESTGRDSRRSHLHPAVATDVPAPGAMHRDGYYTANQSSTRPISQDQDATYQEPTHRGMVSDSLIARHGSATASEEAETPFFLTVDSPIDTAPSIDAVAAQRLRRIGVSHITHLMNQDSNRLADTLGLAGVDAKTIRRWQSECRLMCRVPQLRGFDARVLVGCGINDPGKLASIHPTDLLDRVKTFLATERGQQILLSGTSYELSRITSWIASANQSIQTVRRTRTVDGRPVSTRVTRQRDDRRVRDARELDARELDARELEARELEAREQETYLTDDDFDRERYEVEVERRADRIADEIDELTRDYDTTGTTGSLRSSNRSSSSSRSRSSDRNGPSSRSSNRKGDSDRSRTSASNGSSSTGSSLSRDSRGRRKVSGLRGSSSSESRSRRSERDGRSRSSRRSESSDRSRRNETSTLRFYLERSSDVVDAPSIGPRMAQRLNRIGIETVDDLLMTDAETIAEQLNHRRIDAATVLMWQQQSTLVCRVPMMRGHDAQFVVAAGVTTPDKLAASSTSGLFAKVDEIAHSSEGKRIVRGGKLPDLEEVAGWIANAAQNRSLEAAA